MKRLKAFAVVVAATCTLPAQAQQASKALRLGALGTEAAQTPWPALIEALDKLGYRQGKNLTIIFRAPKGSSAELPALAAELVDQKPDVLLASGTPHVLALKNATSTIPIVMVNVGDPIGTGIVQSLARPGGNVTGTANAVELWTEKRLQMIAEVLPENRCVIFLRNPANPAILAAEPARKAVMAKLGLETRFLDATTPEEVDQVLSRPLESDCNRAMFTPLDAVLIRKRVQIAEFALRNNIALFAPFRADAQAGALITFGINLASQFDLSATYIHAIANGAKPADLPVQQPVKFEMVINLKTAKAIGVSIPASLLISADDVIE
jgi:putative ABC transport system substrate-binding protein